MQNKLDRKLRDKLEGKRVRTAPAGETLAQKRQRWQGKTPDQIIRETSEVDLRRFAARGAPLAQIEMVRRGLADPIFYPRPDPPLDIGV